MGPFSKSGKFRGEHFFGLFVSEGATPDEDYATVADEPLNLREAIEFGAIVINLAAIIEYTQAVSSYRL